MPAVHSNIKSDGSRFYVEVDGRRIYQSQRISALNLENMIGNPRGTRSGIYFDFKLSGFRGIMYYGFIPYGDSEHPTPIYYPQTIDIMDGKASINIKDVMKGRYDMIDWERKGQGSIGYRIVTADGFMLYDGIVTFKGTGPFKVDVTIVEGPFINRVTPDQVVISFETNQKSQPEIEVNDKRYKSAEAGTHHEITVTDLSAATEYDYRVIYGSNSVQYSFKTAPNPGTRGEFVFSYASDSRSGLGGGERDIHGANAYIMKKIMALNKFRSVEFMQFSGDLINGYLQDIGETKLQYANWKRAIQPWAHYFPVYTAMGNHESLNHFFLDSAKRTAVQVDKFPYATESGEAIFAANFVNPENGPDSENGAVYDPSTKSLDFPPYRENVYFYSYDNVAVVVLNSNYWFAPYSGAIPMVGGGLHGYIMDQQLTWLENTIQALEQDNNIDHIFLTLHTPFFPNGGHTQDDMWYSGNNEYRPYVGDQPLEKGIIERRDQLLEILVNKSDKVRAILTGDEHNYAKTEIGPDTNIYPDDYQMDKITLTRTIYQINNGAAGAPYYAQEQTPWTPFVTGFTTQNALVFFRVIGQQIEMEVLNPDTLEEVDKLKLH